MFGASVSIAAAFGILTALIVIPQRIVLPQREACTKVETSAPDQRKLDSEAGAGHELHGFP